MEEGRKLRREDGEGSAGITEHLTRRVGGLLVPSAKPECSNHSFQTLKVGSAGAPEDWKISDSGAPGEKLGQGRGCPVVPRSFHSWMWAAITSKAELTTE